MSPKDPDAPRHPVVQQQDLELVLCVFSIWYKVLKVTRTRNDKGNFGKLPDIWRNSRCEATIWRRGETNQALAIDRKERQNHTSCKPVSFDQLVTPP
jgi:hypothetical protein